MLISNLILSVAETDSGRYDCLYNGQLVSSFHIAVDSHRLALACFWQNILEISPIYRTNPKHIFICIVLFIFSSLRCSAPNKTADYQKIYSDWWEMTKCWKNQCLPKWNFEAPPKSSPINWTNSRKKTSIIYQLWCARCNQFEKYKLALKTWEKRKGQCSPVPVIPQLASNEVSSNNPTIHFLALKNSSWKKNSHTLVVKCVILQVFDTSRFF